MQFPRSDSLAHDVFAGPTTKTPQARTKAPHPPNRHHATPSPLNGVRAGVRGVTDPGVPVAMQVLGFSPGPLRHPTLNIEHPLWRSRLTSSLAPPSTHPGPLLVRGGEGAPGWAQHWIWLHAAWFASRPFNGRHARARPHSVPNSASGLPWSSRNLKYGTLPFRPHSN